MKATRADFEGENARPLPPIRFAGLLVEGGIIAFDGNVMTGGVGANYLNIGGNVNYRCDTVTVAMRVVSVQTGEILTSVTTTKTVYSVGLQANVYQFVSINKLLQAEAGITKTEPTQLAVRQAIDPRRLRHGDAGRPEAPVVVCRSGRACAARRVCCARRRHADPARCAFQEGWLTVSTAGPCSPVATISWSAPRSATTAPRHNQNAPGDTASITQGIGGDRFVGARGLGSVRDPRDAKDRLRRFKTSGDGPSIYGVAAGAAASSDNESLNLFTGVLKLLLKDDLAINGASVIGPGIARRSDARRQGERGSLIME